MTSTSHPTHDELMQLALLEAYGPLDELEEAEFSRMFRDASTQDQDDVREEAVTSIGFRVFGMQRQDRPDLFSWGKRSDCALLIREDGALVGNYFACLKSRRSFRWVVVGLYWDEPGSLREVLDPVLARLEAYEP